jgi:hypothetical protein
MVGIDPDSAHLDTQRITGEDVKIHLCTQYYSK